MSFQDPQSVSIAGVAVSLPRVSAGPTSSIYLSNDGLIRMTASHNYGKRTRRTLRLEHSKIASDPFASGVNKAYSMTVYQVWDVPTVGYTVPQQKEVSTALNAYLQATSGAIVDRILGGEN